MCSSGGAAAPAGETQVATTAASETLATAWLAAIVESSDEAIVSKTLDGVVTSWNPAAERLFGYSANEVIGRHISILAAPGHEDEMPAILERLRSGQKVERYETVRRRKDGSSVDVSLTVSPIRDEAGRIIGASKIARDITAHKRAEAALRDSEERFRNLANVVPDGVWTADADGSITFANDRWFHYCGIAPEQNARQWPELVLHPDDRERCIAQWSRALREGVDYEIEVRNRRHDGEYRWFLTRASPIRDAAGRITAWFGSTTDIHDRKLAEERQQTLAAELSHRVKNLLTVIQVLAERTGDRAASVKQFLEAFRGRIQAINSAQSALMASDWHGQPARPGTRGARAVSRRGQPHRSRRPGLPDHVRDGADAHARTTRARHQCRQIRRPVEPDRAGSIDRARRAGRARRGAAYRLAGARRPPGHATRDDRLRHDHARQGHGVSASGERGADLAENGAGLLPQPAAFRDDRRLHRTLSLL
jgi:PAS domain S-box-containing protein